MAESISEKRFEELADAELHRLVAALDEVGEEIDPELQMGVLSILFEDGGKYVVNSHRAARQIWMAAEQRAWHFDWSDDASAWRTGDDELWSALSEVLTRKLGRTIALR